jgi:hypothetical protein
MDFMHSREYLNRGDVVVVDCSHRCNVMLTDDGNFQRYRQGAAFEYFGGHFDRLPARLRAPSSGFWNITLDLGGGSANIRYSMNVLRAAA